MADREAIEDLVRKVLATHDIRRVDVEESVNRDGEGVLSIRIVYADDDAFTGPALLDVVDALWEHTRKSGPDMIVVPSFVSSHDYETEKSAA
ncbi:MAG: hypothetical protein H5U20_04985 [Rhodobacteraceae bacterium]|nr:hypothetical protein [Paracoccaceae bacterium]